MRIPSCQLECRGGSLRMAPTTPTLSPRDTSANGACKVGATALRVPRKVGVVSPRHVERGSPPLNDALSDS